MQMCMCRGGCEGGDVWRKKTFRSGEKLSFSIEEKYFYVNCSSSLSLILISSFKILFVAFLGVDFLREVYVK